MARVFLVAVCAAALSGCASWVPTLDVGGYVAELRVESEPSGAEARVSAGQSCRTPCTLAVEARGDFDVNFTLEGHVPQTARVHVRVPGDPRFDPNAVANVQFDPNPLAVVLEPAPPPPRQRKPVRRRGAPAKQAPVAAAAPAPPPTVAAPQAAPPPVAAPQPAGPRLLPSTVQPLPGATITPIQPAGRP